MTQNAQMNGQRWFRHELRVRYQETDQMGVVYHANYLNYFEIGRTELIRRIGMPYRQFEERGLLLPVVETELKFRLPARYDDRIAVFTMIEELNGLRIHFAYEVRRLPSDLPAAESSDDRSQARNAVLNVSAAMEPEGELLTSGRTKHVWLNRAWKPVRIDREAPDLYQLLQS